MAVDLNQYISINIQTLIQYTYCINNPYKYFDPHGLINLIVGSMVIGKEYLQYEEDGIYVDYFQLSKAYGFNTERLKYSEMIKINQSDQFQTIVGEIKYDNNSQLLHIKIAYNNQSGTLIIDEKMTTKDGKVNLRYFSKLMCEINLGKNISANLELSDLENIKWNNTNQELVDEINNVMNLFKINTGSYAVEKVLLFIASAMEESGRGGATIPSGHKSYVQVIDSSYRGDPNYRGAGALQLTNEYNYKSFYQYMRDIMKKDDPSIKNVTTDSMPYDVVADNYVWISAVWIWRYSDRNIHNMISSRLIDSSYDVYGQVTHSLTYNERMFLGVSYKINGSEFFDRGYQRIVRGEGYKKDDKYFIPKNGNLPQSETNLPINWDNRLLSYREVVREFFIKN